MNTVIIKGNLCADPETRVVGESSKCSFRLAVRRDFKNKQTDQYESDFFNVEAWGALADFVAKHFHKGKEALVVGAMHSREYEKDGAKRIAWELRANKVEFCGKREERPVVPTSTTEFAQVDDEEQPF